MSLTLGLLGIDILLQFTAADAFHNSKERFPPPQCHEGTREVTWSQIITWIAQTHNNINPTTARILWLHGPAGAGKSAIAESISEKPEAHNMLAGSFFFSWGNDQRGTTQFFISTIAYQLCHSIPGM
jgi:sigma54-dependent transcription regulator